MRSHAPQDIGGWDSTGAVRATLGADGLPTAVHVEHGWRRRVSPELLGSAVMEASSAAVSEQMAVWSQTLGTLPRPDRVDRLETEPRPNPAPSLGAHGPARDFGELTEDVLRSLGEVRGLTRASSEPGVGSHRSRHVTVEVSPTRLTSCTIDAAWAAGQSGHDLSTVLSQALAAAR